jgi:hypothetical protein
MGWIWLTHPDRDHTGGLFGLLHAAPLARVVATSLGAGIMSTERPLPLDRVYLLNPGQSLESGDRRLHAFRLAQHLTGVASRYAQINDVLHAAADGGEEDLRELWEAEENQRLTGARLWIEVLAGKGPQRPGLSRSDAIDVLWLLMSPDNCYRLVHRRRWARQTYQRWLAAAITQLLLADHP